MGTTRSARCTHTTYQTLTNKMSYTIRDFETSDAAAVNRVALAAFEEYRNGYSDWASLAERLASMSDLSETGEIVVASFGDEILGAVAYVGPNKPKNRMFEAEWPIIRSLVVDPSSRGQGIGRSLTEHSVRSCLKQDLTYQVCCGNAFGCRKLGTRLKGRSCHKSPLAKLEL